MNLKAIQTTRMVVVRLSVVLVRSLAIGACLCLFLAACTRRISNKSEVFEHYFGKAPPKGANIIAASYWATYRVGLDDEELILDAELPEDFLQANIPIPDLASRSDLYKLESLSAIGGGKATFTEAMKDRPAWFKPDELSQLSTVSSGKVDVIIFANGEQPSRFQLWLSNRGSGRLLVDRQTRHIYVHDGP